LGRAGVRFGVPLPPPPPPVPVYLPAGAAVLGRTRPAPPSFTPLPLDQGLTLDHHSAQLEPFLTRSTP